MPIKTSSAPELVRPTAPISSSSSHFSLVPSLSFSTGIPTQNAPPSSPPFGRISRYRGPNLEAILTTSASHKDNPEMSNRLSLRMVSVLHLPVNTVSSISYELSGHPRPNPAVIRGQSRIFFLLLVEELKVPTKYSDIKQLIATSSSIQATHSTLF